MNEEYMQNGTYLSNAASNQKNRLCCRIGNTSFVKQYIRNGLDVLSLVRTNTDVSDFYDGVKTARNSMYSLSTKYIPEKPDRKSVLKKAMDMGYNGVEIVAARAIHMPGFREVSATLCGAKAGKASLNTGGRQ